MMRRSQGGKEQIAKGISMLQIAICEDEQSDREALANLLEQVLDKYALDYRITAYRSGEELLESGILFQLIFLDIVMEGRSGIDIGQEIYGKNQSAKIIYQTNFGEYCKAAVNTAHAFAFLEKPISETILEQQIREFLKHRQREDVWLEFKKVSYEEDAVWVEKPSVRLLSDDIYYFEYVKSKRKIKIITADTIYEYRNSISDLEKRLFPCGFEPSCRGILVNMRNIAKIRGYRVILKNGASVPLSQKRVAQFKARLNEFIHSGE